MSETNLHPIFKKKARPIYDAEPMKTYDYENTNATPGATPIAQPLAVSSAVPISESNETITSEDSFWNEIDKLNWRDKSDSVLDIQRIRNNFQSKYSKEDKKRIHTYALTFMLSLRDILLNNNQPEELLTHKLLSHIVGKGREFYYAVLDDPDFAMYLLMEDNDEDQDLWKVISV